MKYNSAMKTKMLTAVCLAVAAFAAASAEWARPDLVAKVAAGEIKEARASWWGFDKDDSTRYLQTAIDSGAAKLIVDKMPSPWVTTPLKAASNQHIVFEDGVVLLAKRGEFVGQWKTRSAIALST